MPIIKLEIDSATLRKIDALAAMKKITREACILRMLEKIIGEEEKILKKQNVPVFGALKGKIEIMPDFDEPLEDFKEYME